MAVRIKMTKNKFIKMLPKIIKVAKKLGYAITTHGSFNRDYDLVAVPWTKDAVNSDTIAKAIYKATNAVRWRCFGDNKPHGRKVYCFDWDKTNYESINYCDLSIMPISGVR